MKYINWVFFLWGMGILIFGEMSYLTTIMTLINAWAIILSAGQQE